MPSETFKALKHLDIKMLFIYRIIKLFFYTNSIVELTKIERPLSVRIPALVILEKAKNHRNLCRKMILAKQTNMTKRNMRRIINEKL